MLLKEAAAKSQAESATIVPPPIAVTDTPEYQELAQQLRQCLEKQDDLQGEKQRLDIELKEERATIEDILEVLRARRETESVRAA